MSAHDLWTALTSIFWLTVSLTIREQRGSTAAIIWTAAAGLSGLALLLWR